LALDARPGFPRLVDVRIDQGVIADTSRPTSPSDPAYLEVRRGALLRAELARGPSPAAQAFALEKGLFCPSFFY